MKRYLALVAICAASGFSSIAQNVTINAVNQPAAIVFRSLITQTGKNFVYSSELLRDLRVTVRATNKPLKKVLAEMLGDTGIEFKVNGDNVILKKRKRKPNKTKPKPPAKPATHHTPSPPPQPKVKTRMLDEVIVVSRLEAPAVETAELGAMKVSAESVRNTPTLLGEADVIKALQTQP